MLTRAEFSRIVEQLFDHLNDYELANRARNKAAAKTSLQFAFLIACQLVSDIATLDDSELAAAIPDTAAARELQSLFKDERGFRRFLVAESRFMETVGIANAIIKDWKTSSSIQVKT